MTEHPVKQPIRLTRSRRERFAFISAKLAAAGKINRSDLIAEFSIIKKTATVTMLKYQELHPDRLRYDTVAKAWLEASAPPTPKAPPTSPEMKRIYTRRSYAKNRDERNARSRRERAERPDIWRRQSLLRRYGLTLEQYDTLFENQDGRCAICRKDAGPILHVDHCHNSKAVRGLLCGSCNRMLGMAKDDPEILRGAIRYLEEGK